MWNLQIINNWNIMFDGVERVSSGAARIYFVVFWVLCVIVIANLIIAFVLEAVLSEYESLMNNPDKRINLVNEEDDKDVPHELKNDKEEEDSSEEEVEDVYITQRKNVSIFHLFK